MQQNLGDNPMAASVLTGAAIFTLEPLRIAITQGFDQSSLEEFIKEVIEKYLFSSVPYASKEILPVAYTQVPNSDIDQTLENLDLFL